MKFKCTHCKCKDSYQLTRAAYDDMEYLGEYKIKCRCCSKSFGVRLDGFNVRVVK